MTKQLWASQKAAVLKPVILKAAGKTHVAFNYKYFGGTMLTLKKLSFSGISSRNLSLDSIFSLVVYSVSASIFQKFNFADHKNMLQIHSF